MLRKSWGGVWGFYDDVPRTCTHGRCYASHGVGWGGVGMMTFLGLAHMVDATQVMGWGGVWGGDDDVPRTCTHGGCYARMMTFLGLAHMVDATQVMGRGVGFL